MKDKDLNKFKSKGGTRPSPLKVHNGLISNILRSSSPPNGTKTRQNFSLYDALVELCKEKKMFFFTPLPHIDYIPPRLTQGKIWYISFSCKHPSTGKMRRVRIKFNRGGSLKERKKEANVIIASLDQKLKLGWNPFIEAAMPKGFSLMSEALDKFLDVKAKENEENSMRSYRSFIKTFKDWLKTKGYIENYYTSSFTQADAINFLEDMEDKLSATTYNNYLRFYRSLFNWMVERQYIDENPFGKLRRKPKRLTAKTRRTFTQEEIDRLISHLEKENIPYLVIVMLCYCCFIRPKEIALLKCEDISLDKQLVHIREEIAKNDNESYRTIPDSMMKYVRQLDLSHPDYYLFGTTRGYSFMPSPKPIWSRKISNYWEEYIRPACNFPMDLQFYSLKDTGITNMVSSGVPLTSVQQQADHSSIAITSVYVGKTGKKAAEDLKRVDIID